MKVTNASCELIDVDVPSVFIPLSDDDATKVFLWIKRWYILPEDDKANAIDCEKAIKTAFETLGLVFNTKVYGEVEMDNLRVTHVVGGISLPEIVFSFVPQGIQRMP